MEGDVVVIVENSQIVYIQIRPTWTVDGANCDAVEFARRVAFQAQSGCEWGIAAGPVDVHVGPGTLHLKKTLILVSFRANQSVLLMCSPLLWSVSTYVQFILSDDVGVALITAPILSALYSFSHFNVLILVPLVHAGDFNGGVESGTEQICLLLQTAEHRGEPHPDKGQEKQYWTRGAQREAPQTIEGQARWSGRKHANRSNEDMTRKDKAYDANATKMETYSREERRKMKSEMKTVSGKELRVSKQQQKKECGKALA